MILSGRVTTRPTTTIVSLPEIKQHLRLTWEDEDSYLTSLLIVADEMLRLYCEHSFRPTTYTATLYEFPVNTYHTAYNYSEYPYGHVGNYPVLTLAYPPVTSATITYFDASNVSTTFAAENWTLRTVTDHYSWIELNPDKSWPETYERPDAVSIEYTAGYETVPELAKHAIKLLVGHWYEHREAVDQAALKALPFSLDAIIGHLKSGRALR